MKSLAIKLLQLIIAISTLSIDGFTQAIHDPAKVSTEKELNFYVTEKRGIRADNGVIFVMEKDEQTLTAYKESEVRWTANIIKTCGQPKVGKPEVRFIKLIQDKIQLTFGKHAFASVDILDGRVRCLGED